MDVDWGRLFTGWWLSDSIARICLAFFVTQTLEEGCSHWLPWRLCLGLCIGRCLLRDVRQTEGAHRKSKWQMTARPARSLQLVPAAYKQDQLLISAETWYHTYGANTVWKYLSLKNTWKNVQLHVCEGSYVCTELRLISVLQSYNNSVILLLMLLYLCFNLIISFLLQLCSCACSAAFCTVKWTTEICNDNLLLCICSKPTGLIGHIRFLC